MERISKAAVLPFLKPDHSTRIPGAVEKAADRVAAEGVQVVLAVAGGTGATVINLKIDAGRT